MARWRQYQSFVEPPLVPALLDWLPVAPAALARARLRVVGGTVGPLVVEAATDINASAGSTLISVTTTRVFQYQARADVLFVPAAETVPDQWAPTYPSRIAARRAPPSPSLAFVRIDEVVPPLSWLPTFLDVLRRARPTLRGGAVLGEPTVTVADTETPGGLTVTVTTTRVFQYQARADVYVVPAADTGLSWFPSYPDPLALANPLFQYQGFADGAAVETVPFDWRPTYPLRLEAPARPFDLPFVQPLFVEARTDDLAWRPTFPDALRRARRMPESALALPTFVELPGELSWWPRYPVALRRARTAREGWVAFQPPIADVVAPDRAWAPVFPDRLARLRRSSSLFDGGGLLPPMQTGETASGALGGTPLLARRRFLYQGFVEPLVPLPGFSIGWLPTYPTGQELRRFPRMRPGLVAFQNPDVLALQWLPTFPDILRRARRPSWQQECFFTNAPEGLPVPPLAWLGVFPDVLRRARTRRWMDSVFFLLTPDTFPGAPPLSWGPTYPVALRRSRTNRQMEASFFALGNFAPSPPLAWGPSYPNRLRSGALRRLLIEWEAVEPILPIPNPPGAGIMLDWRQQKSWYRSSSG